MDVLKPFVLLACVAFAVGFLGFLGLVEAGRPSPTETAWTYQDAAPSPPSSPSSSTVSAPLATSGNPGRRV